MQNINYEKKKVGDIFVYTPTSTIEQVTRNINTSVAKLNEYFQTFNENVVEALEIAFREIHGTSQWLPVLFEPKDYICDLSRDCLPMQSLCYIGLMYDDYGNDPKEHIKIVAVKAEYMLMYNCDIQKWLKSNDPHTEFRRHIRNGHYYLVEPSADSEMGVTVMKYLVERTFEYTQNKKSLI